MPPVDVDMYSQYHLNGMPVNPFSTFQYPTVEVLTEEACREITTTDGKADDVREAKN